MASTGLQLTPLADLLAEPPEAVSWVIGGLLPTAGLSILAGKPKAGKSTLARCMAMSVASGADVLGRRTLQGPVIYVGLEDKRPEIAEHFRAMGATTEPILVHAGPVLVGSDQAIQELEQLILDHHPVLVVIDTMLRFVRVHDTSAYAEMTATLDPILTLARQTGCHIMLVHHAGKQDRDDLDSILGSVAITGSVDTPMIVRRQSGERTLASQQRYGTDLPETVLRMDPVTRQINGCGTIAIAQMTSKKTAILDQLKLRGTMTRKEIADSVRGETKKLGIALQELTDSGGVIRNGKGGKGSPHSYSLPDSICVSSPIGEKGKTNDNLGDTLTGTDSNSIAPLSDSACDIDGNDLHSA